jgi:hypothetical protein
MTEPTQRFPERDVSEERTVSFDFSPDLETGETLAGTPTAEVVDVKFGSPVDQSELIVAGTALDDTKKIILVPTGVVDSAGDYVIKAHAATSTEGKTLTLKAILPVTK